MFPEPTELRCSRRAFVATWRFSTDSPVQVGPLFLRSQPVCVSLLMEVWNSQALPSATLVGWQLGSQDGDGSAQGCEHMACHPWDCCWLPGLCPQGVKEPRGPPSSSEMAPVVNAPFYNHIVSTTAMEQLRRLGDTGPGDMRALEERGGDSSRQNKAAGCGRPGSGTTGRDRTRGSWSH